MTLIGKRVSAIALTAAAVLSAAVLAPPASAADSQCTTTWSCVWTDSNYNSSFSFRGNANYNEWYPVGGFIYNDSISSIWNRNQSTKHFYEHANEGGAVLTVYRNERISNLEDRHTNVWYHTDWNDFISSVD